MGTWGSGNFDGDTAADHLVVVTGGLVDEVEKRMTGEPVELEPDEYWGNAVPANVELLCLIADQGWVGAVLPPVATAERWKTTFLAVWDATIDGLEPTAEFKAERRAVLVATFDRLVAAASARE